MPASNALTEHVGAIALPSDVVTQVDAALAATKKPLCTPRPDASLLRAKLAAGATTAAELLRSPQTAIGPGDAALVGQLVARVVERRDVVLDGDADVLLDQSVSPRRGHVCVPGSLVVRGDLRVVAPLVVCGDLDVSGMIVDCGPQSVIVVLGDVNCRVLRTTGEVLVYGSLRASGFVWGYYNDNVLEVHGTLAAPVIMADDHAIEAGTIEVVHRPPGRGDWGADIFDMGRAHRHALAALVRDPAVVIDGDVDIEALARLARPWAS
ncbi:hypothetical protein [Nannocystis radixulma]|uniref:Uncharacterized protein n=1 Tax=Nannocystis radixulma TaxID=2995305 RepID=A0ABT5BGJ0_9BACT|nr:hypothetical protein [Nannocystis radixulma]MDC0672157.1 hypothetical protein [Nannocystis radixulma]